MKKLFFSGKSFAKLSMFAAVLAGLTFSSCNDTTQIDGSEIESSELETRAVSVRVNEDEDASNRVVRSGDTWTCRLFNGDSRVRNSDPNDRIARAEAFTASFSSGSHAFDGTFNINNSGVPDRTTIFQLFNTTNGPEVRAEVVGGKLRFGSNNNPLQTNFTADGARITVNVDVTNRSYRIRVNGTDVYKSGTKLKWTSGNIAFRWGLYLNDPATKDMTNVVSVTNVN